MTCSHPGACGLDEKSRPLSFFGWDRANEPAIRLKSAREYSESAPVLLVWKRCFEAGQLRYFVTRLPAAASAAATAGEILLICVLLTQPRRCDVTQNPICHHIQRLGRECLLDL